MILDESRPKSYRFCMMFLVKGLQFLRFLKPESKLFALIHIIEKAFLKVYSVRLPDDGVND